MYRPNKKYKNKLCVPAVLSVADGWCRAVNFSIRPCAVESSHSMGSKEEPAGVSGRPQAETKGLGRYGLGQRQDGGSARV